MRENNLTNLFKLTFISLFLTVSISVNANILTPQIEHCLYEHMLEVNAQWAKQSFNLDELDVEVQFDNDVDRIQMHLQLVESVLRNRTVGHLSPAQQQARLDRLDDLKAYWKKAVFPINNQHSSRQPYFVDDYGTACAVGHLAMEAEATQLVEQISRENNFAYIHEMDYPTLNQWATDHGFTMDELAWIQPGYSPQPRPFASLGNNGGCNGKINVMKTNPDGSLLFIAGDFSEIDGQSANSIIAWDGNDWVNFDGLVCGEIFDIEFDWLGRLYIAGNFDFCGGAANINFARWNGESWDQLNTFFDGPVYTMERSGTQLYVGGEFSMINGQTFSNIALYKVNQETWENSGYDDGALIEGALSVNGPVREILKINNYFLFGGSFTQTGNQAPANTVNAFETDYLAYWGGNDWVSGFDCDIQEIHSMTFHNGDLWVGGDLFELNSYAKFSGGLWFYQNSFAEQFLSLEDNLIHGFLAHGDDFYTYGNINYVPFVGTYGSGLLEGTQYVEGGAIFNGGVTAGAIFQGEPYFAGDFSMVNNNEINSITYISSTTSTEDPLQTEKPIEVYASSYGIHVNYSDLQEKAILSVFNVQGQFITSISLEEGGEERYIDTGNYASGTYFYKIQAKGFEQSDKLAVLNN